MNRRNGTSVVWHRIAKCTVVSLLQQMDHCGSLLGVSLLGEPLPFLGGSLLGVSLLGEPLPFRGESLLGEPLPFLGGSLLGDLLLGESLLGEHFHFWVDHY